MSEEPRYRAAIAAKKQNGKQENKNDQGVTYRAPMELKINGIVPFFLIMFANSKK